MKTKLILLISMFWLPTLSFAQQGKLVDVLNTMSDQDTVYLNFCISPGEFGSAHEGIFLYRDKNNFFGKHVIYNYGVSVQKNVVKLLPGFKFIPLERDSIIMFYSRMKTDYTVRRDSWRLDDKQVSYVKQYLSDLENFKPQEGFSNAPEHYTIMSRDYAVVVFDRLGKWNKFLEIKKMLALDQPSP